MGDRVPTVDVTRFDTLSASEVVNENFRDLSDALDNVLFNDNPKLSGPLDANSQHIINLPDATNNSQPITYRQFLAEKKGEPGEQGPAGPIGIKGDTGPAGPKGDIGDVTPVATAARDQAVAAAASTQAVALELATRAKDFLPSETNKFVLDASSNLTSAAVYVKDSVTPSNNFEGSVKNWLPALTFPPRSVVDQNGIVRTTADGEVPYDWSRIENGKRVRRIKVVGANDFMFLFSRMQAPHTILIEAEWEHIGEGYYNDFFVLDGGASYVAVSMNDADNAGGHRALVANFVNGVGTGSHGMGQVSDVVRSNGPGTLGICMSWDSEKGMESVNGELTNTDPRIDSDIPLTRAIVGGNNCVVYLKRITFLPRTLAPTEVCNIGGLADYHPHILSSVVMQIESQTPDTNRARMATFGYSGNNLDVAYLNGQHLVRKNGGDPTHGESPVALYEMPVKVDLKTGRISSLLTSSILSVAPVGWNDTLTKGWIASPMTHTIKSGPYKGRQIQFAEIVTSPDGVPGPGSSYVQSIFYRYRDSINSAWSTFVKVVDGAVQLDHPVVSMGVAGRVVEWPTTSDKPGRIGMSIHTFFTNKLYFMYFDGYDPTVPGAIKFSAPIVAGGNETATATRPDNSLVMISRQEDSTHPRTFVISTDYGQTFSSPALLPASEGETPVAASATQIDPSGVFGRKGRIAYLRAIKIENIGRSGLLASFYDDDLMTPKDEIYLGARYREYGYCDIADIGNGLYAIATEISMNGFNTFSSTGIMVGRWSAKTQGN